VSALGRKARGGRDSSEARAMRSFGRGAFTAAGASHKPRLAITSLADLPLAEDDASTRAVGMTGRLSAEARLKAVDDLSSILAPSGGRTAGAAADSAPFVGFPSTPFLSPPFVSAGFGSPAGGVSSSPSFLPAREGNAGRRGFSDMLTPARRAAPRGNCESPPAPLLSPSARRRA